MKTDARRSAGPGLALVAVGLALLIAGRQLSVKTPAPDLTAPQWSVPSHAGVACGQTSAAEFAEWQALADRAEAMRWAA